MDYQSRINSSHKNNGFNFFFLNATSDLTPFGTFQLLRFEKRAHGNISGGILIITYHKFPTTYLALNQMEVL